MGEKKNGKLGKHEELYNWLVDQPEELQKVFSPYLKFKVWK